MASELWGNENLPVHKYGEGMVYSRSYSLDSLLLENGILPDMKTKDNDPVLFIHRHLTDGEIYFVSNQSESYIEITPEFRVKDMQPELWNPVTGEMRYLPEYKSSKNGISVNLYLDKNESVFVVFRSSKKLLMEVRIIQESLKF